MNIVSTISGSDLVADMIRPCGGISQITDPLGRTVTYAYEPPTGGYGVPRLRSVTNPAGGTTTYGYAAPYNIGSITDARGIPYLTNTYCSGGTCPPDPAVVSRPPVRDGKAPTVEGVFQRVSQLKPQHDGFWDR